MSSTAPGRRSIVGRALLSMAVASCASVARSTPAPAPALSPRPAPTGADVATRAGCDGATLLAPATPIRPGPWPVGARTVASDGLTLEVWYPAAPTTANAEAPRARYDLRTAMPEALATAIPDAAAPWLDCACGRDLALDRDRGPYPVVVFLHGAASFRAQSTSLATAWASHGFIVIAPDLPGIGLRAALGDESSSLPFTAPAQVLDLIATAPVDDPLSFVRDRLAPRVAVVGHSLGALLSNSTTERAEVALTIGLAPGLIVADGKPRLVVAGGADQIVAIDRVRDQARAAGAAFVGIAGATHLSFTDLCAAGAEHGGPLGAARAFGIAVPPALESLVGDACRAPDPAIADQLAGVTTAALIEALQCTPSASLSEVAAQWHLEFLPRP